MHARVETNLLPGFLSVQPDGVTLAVKVTPRAPKDEIGEVLGAELRVKVTAPPVDAAANEALNRLLAEKFDCPRSAVQIVRGQISRYKIVKLREVSAAAVMAKLSGSYVLLVILIWSWRQRLRARSRLRLRGMSFAARRFIASPGHA